MGLVEDVKAAMDHAVVTHKDDDAFVRDITAQAVVNLCMAAAAKLMNDRYACYGTSARFVYRVDAAAAILALAQDEP